MSPTDRAYVQTLRSFFAHPSTKQLFSEEAIDAKKIEIVSMFFDIALQSGSTNIIVGILNYHSYVPFLAGLNLCTELLHYAIKKNEYILINEIAKNEALKSLVVENPYSYSQMSPIDTAMLISNTKQRESMLKKLTGTFFDIDMQNGHNQTALMKAVIAANRNTTAKTNLELLLKLGANPDCKTTVQLKTITPREYLKDKYGSYETIREIIENHVYVPKTSTSKLSLKGGSSAKQLTIKFSEEDTKKVLENPSKALEMIGKQIEGLNGEKYMVLNPEPEMAALTLGEDGPDHEMFLSGGAAYQGGDHLEG